MWHFFLFFKICEQLKTTVKIKKQFDVSIFLCHSCINLSSLVSHSTFDSTFSPLPHILSLSTFSPSRFQIFTLFSLPFSHYTFSFSVQFTLIFSLYFLAPLFIPLSLLLNFSFSTYFLTLSNPTFSRSTFSLQFLTLLSLSAF